MACCGNKSRTDVRTQIRDILRGKAKPNGQVDQSPLHRKSDKRPSGAIGAGLSRRPGRFS